MTDVLSPPAPVQMLARTRLTSLDLLRGLAVAVMILVNVPGDHSLHPSQLVHVDWDGFRVAEAVFPGFIVASGGALALSARSASLRSIVVRTSRLFIIGLLLIWWKYGEVGFRTGTLQFIAVSWLVAALLHRLPSKWRLPAALAVLGAVALVHEIPSLPGATGWGVDGIDARIDAPLFAGRSDVGLLGMLSAGAVGAVAAAVVGTVRTATPRRRIAVFAVAAVGAALAAAVAARIGVPVVKRTWSPSYLFLGASVCAGVMAVGEAIAATPARRLLVPVVALGTNALPLYIVSTVLAIVWTSDDRHATTAWLVRRGLGGEAASLSISVAVLALITALAWWFRRTGRVVRL